MAIQLLQEAGCSRTLPTALLWGLEGSSKQGRVIIREFVPGELLYVTNCIATTKYNTLKVDMNITSVQTSLY